MRYLYGILESIGRMVCPEKILGRAGNGYEREFHPGLYDDGGLPRQLVDDLNSLGEPSGKKQKKRKSTLINSYLEVVILRSHTEYAGHKILKTRFRKGQDSSLDQGILSSSCSHGRVRFVDYSDGWKKEFAEEAVEPADSLADKVSKEPTQDSSADRIDKIEIASFGIPIFGLFGLTISRAPGMVLTDDGEYYVAAHKDRYAKLHPVVSRMRNMDDVLAYLAEDSQTLVSYFLGYHASHTNLLSNVSKRSLTGEKPGDFLNALYKEYVRTDRISHKPLARMCKYLLI